MEELLINITEPWAIRALIASSLVGIMCGTIGCFIVLRNMSLIGDALAHAILPGVFFAFLIVGYSTIGFFLGSVIAGIVTAVGITWIQHKVKTKNDAAIGIVFTAMFSIGVMGISWLNKEEGVHLDLQDFLFGNVLSISNQDLILTAIFTVYSLISIILFYRYLFITTFQPTIAQTMGISVKTVHYFLMLLLSFAVVSALSTVGVILVVAMLITPAASALLLSNKLKRVIVISAILGLFSAILGFIASVVFDTTPGPAMAIAATLFYFTAVFFAPQRGLIAKGIRQRRQRIKIEREDILRQAIKYHNISEIETKTIASYLDFSDSKLNRHLNFLKTEGLITLKGKTLELTLKGVKQAQDLVRAHRLWESYQVNTMGLQEGQIHDEADRIEHVLTTELVDEVEAHLGYPKTDPHGSPIPEKKVLSLYSILKLRPKSRAKISETQINDKIESELWELGILPNNKFVIDSMDKENVYIKLGNKKIRIPAQLAGQINVKPI